MNKQITIAELTEFKKKHSQFFRLPDSFEKDFTIFLF